MFYQEQLDMDWSILEQIAAADVPMLSQSPEDDYITEETKALTRVALRFLKPRERSIIKHLFGIDNAKEMTPHELSKMFGVTYSRIKQIEAKTLERLRKNEQLLSVVGHQTCQHTKFDNKWLEDSISRYVASRKDNNKTTTTDFVLPTIPEPTASPINPDKPPNSKTIQQAFIEQKNSNARSFRSRVAEAKQEREQLKARLSNDIEAHERNADSAGWYIQHHEEESAWCLAEIERRFDHRFDCGPWSITAKEAEVLKEKASKEQNEAEKHRAYAKSELAKAESLRTKLESL